MGFLDIFKKKNNAIENIGSVATGTDISSAVFMSSSPTYHSQAFADIIGGSSISYNLALSIGASNTVVSRFVDLISSAISNLSIVNKEGDEVTSGLSNKIKEDVMNIFGGEDRDLAEYIFNSINSMVCCGMKITAPSVIDQKGQTAHIEVLDTRKVLFLPQKDGSLALQYQGKQIPVYHKKIAKPSLNRKGYGDCMFTGAVKDALMDSAIKDAGISFYRNDASPEVLYFLGKENGTITDVEATAFERRLKEKYQGTDKKGLPMASNIVKSAQVIDASAAIIKSIDSRLYSSKMLGMQLGIDIRALGWLRDGGSQAELYAVLDMVNTVIERRARILSDSITSEYNKMVANTNGLSIKFLPTYYKNNQQIISNALLAEKQGCVDKEYVQNLIYNQ